MMLVYRRAAILEEWRAALAWLTRACRADVPGIWSDTSHKTSFARQSCTLIGVPVWQHPGRAVDFVGDDGHAKPRTRFLHLGGFFESCLVLCWPWSNAPKSVARIKPQYAENLGLQIISRLRQGSMSTGLPNAIA